jgi:ABC-2 type transport system permease protein
VLDKSGKIKLESGDRYEFITVTGELEQVKKDFKESKDFGILHIVPFELSKPEGMTLYTKENPSIRRIEDLERMLETQVHDLKLEQFNIDKETLKSLKTSVDISSIPLKDDGEEKESNTGMLYVLGFILGLLIYIFVLVYGMQIMLGVIEEKTSKVVEVILSSVRPFQLMLGKILGIAAVGLLQFTIWVILVSVLSSFTLSMFGMKMPQQQAMEQVQKEMAKDPETADAMKNNKMTKIMNSINEIPIGSIVFNFAFYFLGGYLLYGSLFAAVGAAVDSQQEAQQFNLPIMLPLIIGY